jgi:hypothetical protein
VEFVHERFLDLPECAVSSQFKLRVATLTIALQFGHIPGAAVELRV